MTAQVGGGTERIAYANGDGVVLNGSIITHENGALNVKHGDIVFEAKSNAPINVGGISFQAAPGTVIWVSKSAGVIKVRNLYDVAKRSLQVNLDGVTTTIGCGEEMVFAADSDIAHNALAADKIARRGMKEIETKDGAVVTSEISLPTIFNNAEAVQHIFHSADKADQALAHKLLKMAAILMQVRSKYGAYQQISQR
jgi:hypothetical protein